MNFEIVPAEERYVDSHAVSLDQVSRERRFLSMIEGPPLEKVREFVKSILATGEIQHYAVHQGQAIGWCDILRKGLPTLRHTGVLGMGIRRGYRGMGLGARLLESTLAAADAKGIERVELWVLDRNQNAKALYLKHGFKVEGRMERYMKVDGIFHSANLMSRMH